MTIQTRGADGGGLDRARRADRALEPCKTYSRPRIHAGPRAVRGAGRSRCSPARGESEGGVSCGCIEQTIHGQAAEANMILDDGATRPATSTTAPRNCFGGTFAACRRRPRPGVHRALQMVQGRHAQRCPRSNVNESVNQSSEKFEQSLGFAGGGALSTHQRATERDVAQATVARGLRAMAEVERGSGPHRCFFSARVARDGHEVDPIARCRRR